MDWTRDQLDELTRLWGEGLTGAEIGRRMGISKNAVVGKAHRLHLPGRPSPIRQALGGVHPMSKSASPRQPGSTARRGSEDVGARANVGGEPQPARVRTRRAPVFVPDPRHVTDSSLSRAHCAFPLWDDDAKRPDQRFCGTPIERGKKPYCGYHTVVAHFGFRHADAVAQGLPAPAPEPEPEIEPFPEETAA